MADIKHVIEPENHGLWIVVTFIIALLALVVALVGVYRTYHLTYVTQAEVLHLNKKIDAIKAPTPAPAEPAAQAQ